MAQNRDILNLPAPRAGLNDTERLRYDGRVYDAIVTTADRVTALELANLTTFAVTLGGTGLSEYAVGDVLYADTTASLARRAIGDDGDVFTVVDGLPGWATPAAASSGDSEWTDGGAYLYPADGVAEAISIGSTSAPTGGALLGVTGAVVAHTHGSGSATGDARWTWIANAALSAGGEEDCADGDAVHAYATEGTNSIYLGVGGNLCWAIQHSGVLSGGVAGSLMPLVDGQYTIGSQSYAIAGVYSFDYHVKQGSSVQATMGHNGTDATHSSSVGGLALASSGIGTNWIKIVRGVTVEWAWEHAGGTGGHYVPQTTRTYDIGRTALHVRDFYISRAIYSAQATEPTGTLTSTTLNDGGGSGAAVAITTASTDICGSFTITAGNGTPGAGIAAQVVFNTARSAAPKSVILTCKDADGTDNAAYVSATATTSFTVSFNVALTASEAVEFYYVVAG